MASIRIKRKSTESAYGSTTTLLPGELAVAGKWLWYGPKETSTDDAQVQARPVYSPTTLGDSGSILISNGTDLGWIKKGSAGQILTSTKDGISWSDAPKQFSLSLNGITYSDGSLSWYAPTSSGTSGQYLKSAGENGVPTWVNFPISITLNGTKTEEPVFYAPTSAGTNGYILYSNGDKKAPTWKAAPTFTDTNQTVKAYATMADGLRDYVTFGDDASVTIMSGSDNIKITASDTVNNISIWGPDVYDNLTESGVGYYSVSYINSMFNTLAGQNEFIGVYTENDLTSANIQSKLNAFVLSKAGRNSRNGDLVNIKNTTVYNGEQWRYDGATSSWAYYIDWKDTTLDQATYTTLGGVKLGASDTFTGTAMAAVPAGKGFPVLLNADGRMFANVYGYTPEPTSPTTSTNYTVSVRNNKGTYETCQITQNVTPGSIVMRAVGAEGYISVPLTPTLNDHAASKKYVDDNVHIYTASTGLDLTDGAFKAKLKDETANANSATKSASTANRLYAVEVDKEGYLSVTVPWKDTNTTYTGTQGVEIISSNQIRAKLQDYTQNTNASLIKSTTANRLYPVELDSTGALAVTVPWSNTTYTSGVGLSLSSNVFKAKLRDETKNTSASAKAAATTNRLYSVEVDKDGYLSVTVPWTDNNTTYTGKEGVEITTSHEVRAKLQNYTLNTSAAYVRSETAGRLYPVELDSTGVLSVTVPWTDTNTTYTASTGLALNGTAFKAKLRNETKNVSASVKSAATASRLYAVEVDKDGYLSVTVPWTDTNTTYSAGKGISISDAKVISVKYATTTEVGGFTAGTYTGENDSKATALVMSPNGLLDVSIDCGTWA